MAAAIRDLGLPVWTIDVAPPVDKQPEVATDLHEAVEVVTSVNVVENLV
jgi:hypothetical protein